MKNKCRITTPNFQGSNLLKSVVMATVGDLVSLLRRNMMDYNSRLPGFESFEVRCHSNSG